MKNSAIVCAPERGSLDTDSLAECLSFSDSVAQGSMPSCEFDGNDIVALAKELYVKCAPAYDDGGMPVKEKGFSIEDAVRLSFDFLTARKQYSVRSSTHAKTRLDELDIRINAIFKNYVQEESDRKIYLNIKQSCEEECSNLPSEQTRLESNILAANQAIVHAKDRLAKNSYERNLRELRRLQNSARIVGEASIDYFGRVYSELDEKHVFWRWLENKYLPENYPDINAKQVVLDAYDTSAKISRAQNQMTAFSKEPEVMLARTKELDQIKAKKSDVSSAQVQLRRFPQKKEFLVANAENAEQYLTHIVASQQARQEAVSQYSNNFFAEYDLLSQPPQIVQSPPEDSVALVAKALEKMVEAFGSLRLQSGSSHGGIEQTPLQRMSQELRSLGLDELGIQDLVDRAIDDRTQTLAREKRDAARELFDKGDRLEAALMLYTNGWKIPSAGKALAIVKKAG